MQEFIAANRYAQALFEIARGMGKDQAVEDELEAFSAALRSKPEIEKFLLNPSFTAADKKRLLDRLYAHDEGRSSVARVMADFYSILLEKGRFTLVHEIAVAYKRISDLAQGEGVAEVSTTTPLSATVETRLVAALERMTGEKIVLKKKTDPALVGGITVRLRNKFFDGSVAGHLERLKTELTGQWR